MKFRDSGGGVNYWVALSEGIFRPPHPKQIGPALILFAYLERRVTKVNGTDGLVFAGKPLTDAEVAGHMGLSPKTIARMRRRLLRYGYISAKRTGRGYRYLVRKSKKSPLAKAPEIAGSVRSQPSVMDGSVRSDRTHVGNLMDGCVRSRSEERERRQGAVQAAAAIQYWTDIRADLPIGSPAFQNLWQFFHSHRNGAPLSEAMERTIQRAQAQRIPVPPPFYEAKRRVEAEERAAAKAAEDEIPLAEFYR